MNWLIRLLFVACLFTKPAHPDPKIFVFIHACTIGSWEKILDEELTRIQASGLYDASTALFLGVLGTGNINLILHKYPKLTVLFQDPDTGAYERPTLLKIHEFCLTEPDALILYLHTKGVTRSAVSKIAEWRKYMEHFTIDRWKNCVAALTTYEHDICGVNWKIKPRPHFSGNFWWATSKYIATLPHHIGPAYDDTEMWVGQNAPKVRCFWQSGINHYFKHYPEKEYFNRN